MIKKYLVESMTDDMPTRVHYNGTFQPGDVAFCGADLMGDNHLGWHAAIETDRRVDCEACIRQLKHAKAILSQNKNNPS